MNTEWNAPQRRSNVLAYLDKHNPKLLKYHEDRRIGKSEAKLPKQKTGMCYEEARRLYQIEHSTVQHVFYPVDYSPVRTWRGGKSSHCACDMCWLTYRLVVTHAAMEPTDQVGPRNEKVEDRVIPLGGLSYEQNDRRDWQASDKIIDSDWERPKDEESVGPLQDTRNGDDVGPMGESSDEGGAGPLEESSNGGNGLQHIHEDKGGEREEGQRPSEEDEKQVASAENKSVLIQFASTALAMMSNSPADAEDVSSPFTRSVEQQPSLISSPSLAAASSASSRKRSRDAEEDTKDEESPQQKRRRMDDVLGIVRKEVKAANVPQNIQAATRLYIKHPKKRANVPQVTQVATSLYIKHPKKQARSLNTDSPKARSSTDTAVPTPKRLRLYQRPRQISGAEKEHVTTDHSGTTMNGKSTLVDHDGSRTEPQQTTDSDKIPADAQASPRIFMEDDSCVDDETESSVARESLINEAEDPEDVSSDDEIDTTQTGWNTAHGINSKVAFIYVDGKTVWSKTGEGQQLVLPKTEGSPNRPWTKAEKETLRAYIQDYGIENWAALSKSTNRAESDLQQTYLNIIIKRNKRAGRPQLAGIPEEYPRYPRFAPPPPPQEPGQPASPPHSPPPSSIEPEESATPTATAELPRLRPRKRTGQIAKGNLGDLAYDVKVRAFPKVTRYGRLVDSKGDTLPEAMGHIPSVAKRLQPKLKLKLKGPVDLSSAEGLDNATSSKMEKIRRDSYIEEGEIIEEESSDQQAQAPDRIESGPSRSGQDPLKAVKNGRVDKKPTRRGVNLRVGRHSKAVDVKEEQSNEREHSQSLGTSSEQEGSFNTVPETQTTPAKDLRGPRLAGVSKLSGSSRRGVPRKAAGLRR